MVMKIPSSYSEQLCLHLVVEVYQLKESAYYWQLLAIIGHYDYVLCCDKVWLGFGDKIDISIQETVLVFDIGFLMPGVVAAIFTTACGRTSTKLGQRNTKTPGHSNRITNSPRTSRHSKIHDK